MVHADANAEAGADLLFLLALLPLLMLMLMDSRLTVFACAFAFAHADAHGFLATPCYHALGAIWRNVVAKIFVPSLPLVHKTLVGVPCHL